MHILEVVKMQSEYKCKTKWLILILYKRLRQKVNKTKTLVFFYQHGRLEPKRTLTSYFCSEYRIDKAICPTTSPKNCFQLHITHGMTAKCRFTK